MSAAGQKNLESDAAPTFIKDEDFTASKLARSASSTSSTKSSKATATKTPGTKLRAPKSRNGCLTCKQKRLKCDETKPACLKCQKKNIVCGGYATKFKWKTFNDSMDLERPTSIKPGPSLDVPASINKHLELASLSVTGKSINDIKYENALIEEGINPNTYAHLRDASRSNAKIFEKLGDSSLHLSQDTDDYITPMSKKLKRSQSMGEHHPHRSLDMGRSHSTAGVMASGIHDLKRRFSTTGTSSTGLNSLAEVAIDEIKSRSPAGSPTFHRKELNLLTPMSDFLTPSTKSPEILSRASKHNVNLGLELHNDPFPDINLSPSLSALVNSAFGHDEDLRQSYSLDEQIKFDIPLSPLNLQNGGMVHDFLEHISAASPGTGKLRAVNPSSITKDLDLKSVGSPYTGSENQIHFHNNLSHSTLLSHEQEQILALYSQYTAEILSIKNGPNENPWRTTILPYAFRYPCLFNSIASLTLFHLAGNESVSNRSGMRAKGYLHMKRCILELVSGLSANEKNGDPSQKIPSDIAIAICLNLAVSETWDKHTSSGIAHLKGAKTMIQNVMTLLKETQQVVSKERSRMSAANISENSDSFRRFISGKKQQLKKEFVLVDDAEWDTILLSSDEENRDALKVPRSTQFLFNMWIYFEVLAQMTTESDEKGIDLVASITSILHDSKKKDPKIRDEKVDNSPSNRSESELSMATMNSFGVHRGFNNLFDNFEDLSLSSDYVDSLLGCAQSLFSIMGKVATLISKIRKLRKKENTIPSRNTLATITTATQLRQDLLSWKPTISASMIEQDNGGTDSSKAELSSYIATAEAYRFASLLLLHQAVPEIPSLSSHQLAEKIFILLASVPSTSSTYTVHIFPLLVASCEAEQPDEREWCDQRWRLLSEKLWIGNVDRAYEVVREVWKRKDEYSRKKSSSLDMGELFISHGSGTDDTEKFKNISTQLSGLMAAINEKCSVNDITGGIYSKLHWGTIMKEWGWEVLLA